MSAHSPHLAVGRRPLLRMPLAAAAALSVALAAGSAAPAAPSAKPPRPNVIVIETDDQDQESIRVMPRTRELIGGQGVTFANSFVNHSLCCPSRATFLTGQYSHNHGVRSNNPPNGGFDRLNSSNTLPVWLQRTGYYTGQIGKYLNGYASHRDDPGGPLTPAGWSEFHGITGSGFYGFELNEGGVLNSYGSEAENPDNPGDPGSYSTDVYTAKAIDFINRRAGATQPFFLWLTYNAPHGGPPDPLGNRCFDTAKPSARHLTAFDSEPLPQPPSFNEADVSDKPPSFRSRPSFSGEELTTITRNYRCRLASLLAVDEGVEQIYAALAAGGALSNTLLVFTSDNGFMHGEHRIESGKIVPYEESIRVPLMIRGPGFRGGGVVRDLAINADLVSTIVRATGAQPALTLDGVGLQRTARSPGRERGRELSIESNAYTGVRTSRYTYLVYTRGENNGFEELYDMRADPFQLQNLAASPPYAAIRAALAERLASLRGCVGESCRYVPRLQMKLRDRDPRRCARRPVRARVRGADAGKVALAEFFVKGRRAARDRKRPFVRGLPFNRLKPTRASLVRVRATLLDGRRVTIDRRLRACR